MEKFIESKLKNEELIATNGGGAKTGYLEGYGIVYRVIEDGTAYYYNMAGELIDMCC